MKQHAHYCPHCDGAGKFPRGFGRDHRGYSMCLTCGGIGLVYPTAAPFDNGIRHDEGEG